MPKDTNLANPVPIGLMGFALTTFIVGLIESNWLTSDVATLTVVPLAIAYGGSVQLVAGVLAWRNGNTLAQTAFLTYGAYWWWFALFQLFSAVGIIGASPSMTAFGVINFGFGVITVLWFVGSLADSTALAAVFGTLALTYGLIGLGYWFEVGALNVWGGYFGLLSALCAAYVAFAKVTNWSMGHDVVPTGPAPISDGSDDSRSGAGQAGD